LSSFTLSNPASKRAVKDYVESQARGERVQHAEKIKSEHLFGRDYDCWDVHTQRDRYWVITSPSNLYSQQFFPSLDFTLSFHVGVTTRIMALQRGAPDEAQRLRLTPVWRRWEEAASSFDAAEEAEDFQAVGMKCRECLIHLGRALGKADIVPEGQEAPQRSNFLGWSEYIANAVAIDVICGGTRRSEETASLLGRPGETAVGGQNTVNLPSTESFSEIALRQLEERQIPQAIQHKLVLNVKVGWATI